MVGGFTRENDNIVVLVVLKFWTRDLSRYIYPVLGFVDFAQELDSNGRPWFFYFSNHLGSWIFGRLEKSRHGLYSTYRTKGVRLLVYSTGFFLVPRYPSVDTFQDSLFHPDTAADAAGFIACVNYFLRDSPVASSSSSFDSASCQTKNE